jgi:transposase InsO family protein
VKEVIKPEVILSDHGSQFTSPLWKETLQNLGITAKFTPIRHPSSNPAERIMKELGKYFRIYCHQSHKQWPELIPYIQKWLNEPVNQVTGYRPIELLGGTIKQEIFKKIIRGLPDEGSQEESLPTKILKVYAKTKKRAEAKKAKSKHNHREWMPHIGDQVLVRCQQVSDAIQGITAKFQRTYIGPLGVKQIINPYLYELADEDGTLKGLYHLSHMKPYVLQCFEL